MNNCGSLTVQKVKGTINLFGQSSFRKTNKCTQRVHMAMKAAHSSKFQQWKMFWIVQFAYRKQSLCLCPWNLIFQTNFKNILHNNKQTNRTKTYFLVRVIDKNIGATLVFTSVGLTGLLSKLSTVLIVWPLELAYNIPDLPCFVL